MKNSKTDQDGTGIHIGMPVYKTKNLEYVQGISIGMPGQEFLVWINLQHYDLIVPSTNCTTIDCGRMKKFDPYGSDFFKASTNYSEVYLSNFEAVGYYGTDFVTFNHSARLSVNNMRFLLAHHLESTAAVKSGFDGVLGLQPNLLHNSFIDSIIKNGYLDKPLLTIWLSARNVPPEVPAGTITYGAIDEAHCSTETILYTQMLVVYLIETDGFGMENYTIAGPQEVEFTMEVWIRMEEKFADRIAGIVGATYDEAINAYNISCDAKFADFKIYVGNVTLAIPSEQLILKVNDAQCVLAITRYEEELGGEPISVGAPFYRQYCTIFDIRNQRVGFAVAVPSTPAPPTTSSVPSKPATSSPIASSSTTLKQTSSLVTTEPTTSSPTTEPTTSSPAARESSTLFSTTLKPSTSSLLSTPTTPPTSAGSCSCAVPLLSLAFGGILWLL